MNYIVSKVELIEGVVTHTPIGYTTEAVTLPCTAFNDWVTLNAVELEAGTKQLSELFDTHPVCHEVGWCTEDMGGLELPVIENPSTLT